jgi:hypothetical protein
LFRNQETQRFFSGFPLSVSRKIIEQHDIDPFNDDLEIEPFFDYAKKAAKINSNIRNFEHLEEEKRKYDKLHENATTYRQYIARHKFNLPLPVSAAGPIITVIVTVPMPFAAALTVTRDDMDRLVEQIGKMTINMNIWVAEMKQGASNQFNQIIIVPNSYDRGSIRCYYCFDPTHIKPNCAKLTENKEKGRYYLREDGKLYIGRPGEGGKQVWIQRKSNMSETDAVRRAFLNFNP